MSLIADIEKERSSTIKMINSVKAQLAKAPKDSLICRCTNGKYRFTAKQPAIKDARGVIRPVREIYLGKDDELLLELAKRDYYKYYMKDLQQELAGLEEYLKCHEQAKNLSDYLERHPGVREVLQPALVDRKNKYLSWAAKSYNSNPNYPEDLIYITDGGFYVRSKAEQMIANMLLAEGIPFRYEDQVVLPDGGFIYPDFHIYSLRDYTEYYLEHNGMMLDDGYFANYENKLRKFRSAGIVPGVNLLQTFEADGYPLNPRAVRDIINTYLK